MAMSWKPLAVLAALALVASGAKRASASTAIGDAAKNEPEDLPDDLPDEDLSDEDVALDAQLAQCEQKAESYQDESDFFGIKVQVAYEAWREMVQAYHEGERDQTEMALDGMDVLLAGCDWRVMIETYSTEELESDGLVDLWDAMVDLAGKVLNDEAFDEEELLTYEGDTCPEGYYDATEDVDDGSSDGIGACCPDGYVVDDDGEAGWYCVRVFTDQQLSMMDEAYFDRDTAPVDMDASFDPAIPAQPVPPLPSLPTQPVDPVEPTSPESPLEFGN